MMIEADVILLSELNSCKKYGAVCGKHLTRRGNSLNCSSCPLLLLNCHGLPFSAKGTRLGGYGTVEEVREMITWSQLGIHWYYNSLLALFDNGVEEGFIKPNARHIILFASTAK